MELRHLRYFVAVAEEGSLTVAATRRLHTAQPSLSRQIRDLEAEIGTRLMTRSTHGITLTAAGETFLDHARSVLAQAQTGAEAARRAALPERIRLSLGFLSGEDVEWLPEAMRVLGDELSRLEIKIVTGHSPDIAAAVSDGRIDVGFIRPERYAPELQFTLLRKEPLLVMMPSDHHLQSLSVIDPAALSGEKFIGISETAPVLRPIVQEFIASTRAEIIPMGEADYLSMALSLVASTRSVALLPSYALNLLPWSVVSRRLKGPLPTVDLVLATRRGNDTPHVRALVARADAMATRVANKSRNLLPA